MFGDRRSYFTHFSTLEMLALRKLRASSPTHTRSMDVSPSRTDLSSVDLEPSWRRIGNALFICRLVTVMKQKKQEVKGKENMNELFEYIQIWVQSPTNALQEKSGDDDIDKVTLESHMVIPNHI